MLIFGAAYIFLKGRKHANRAYYRQIVAFETIAICKNEAIGADIVGIKPEDHQMAPEHATGGDKIRA